MSKTLETLFALVTSSRVGATLGDPRPAFVVGSDGAAVRFLNAAAARLVGVAHADEVLGRGLPLDEAIVRHVARFARNAAPGRQSVEMVRFFDGMKPVLHQCILIHLGVLAGETGVLIILANPPRLIGATDFAASLDLIAASDRLLAAFDAEGEVLAASGDYGFLDGSQDEIERFVVEAGEAAVSRRRYQSAQGPAEAVVVRIGGEAGLRILSIGRVGAPEDEPESDEPETEKPESETDEAWASAGRDEAEATEPVAPKSAATSASPSGGTSAAVGAAPGATVEAGAGPLPARFDPWSDDFAGIGDPVFWGLSPLSIQEDEARWRADDEGAAAAEDLAGGEAIEAEDQPVPAADSELEQTAAESRAAAIVDALEPTVPAPPFPGARPEDLARVVEIVTQGGGATAAAADDAREAAEAPVAEDDAARAEAAAAVAEPASPAGGVEEPPVDGEAYGEPGPGVADTAQEAGPGAMAALVGPGVTGTVGGEAVAVTAEDAADTDAGTGEDAAVPDRETPEPATIETEPPASAQPEPELPATERPAIAEAFVPEVTPAVEGGGTRTDGAEPIARSADAGPEDGGSREVAGVADAEDGEIAEPAGAVSAAPSEPAAAEQAAGVAAGVSVEEPAASEEAKTESAAGPAASDFAGPDAARGPAPEAVAGTEAADDASSAGAIAGEQDSDLAADTVAQAGIAAPVGAGTAPAADEAGVAEPVVSSAAPAPVSVDDRAAGIVAGTDAAGAEEPGASSDTPDAAPDEGDFIFAAVPRLRRFVWQMDAGESFTFVSDELAAAVGPRAAVLTSETWSALAARLGLDPEGRVTAALSRRDTWSGLTVLWPVEGEALRVPVDLAALPAFGRGRTFEGYRGFGICRLAETVPDPAATGLRLRRDETDESGSGEETAEQAPEPSTGEAASGTAPATASTEDVPAVASDHGVGAGGEDFGVPAIAAGIAGAGAMLAGAMVSGMAATREGAEADTGETADTSAPADEAPPSRAEAAERSEAVSETAEPVEATSETAEPVEAASEAAEAASEAVEPVEAVSEAAELVNAVSEAAEPVEAVSEAAEPVEAVSEAAEPVEAVSEAAEPVEAVSEAAEPVEAVSEAAEPVEAASEAVEPVEAVSEAAEPVEAVSEAAEPVEAVSEAAEPVEAVSEAAEPVEAASEAVEPVEAVSEAVGPVEAASEAVEPVEAATEAAVPVEAVFEAAEPVEAASEAVEPVEAVSEAAEPVEAVSEAAEPVEAVSEAAEPVEVASEAVEPVEAASEAVEPVEAASEAVEPVEAASEAVEPVEAASEAVEPVEAASEAVEPVEAASEAVEPVEAASEAVEPVEAASETVEMVEAVSEVAEPVEAASEAAEPVEAVSEAVEPVEAVAATEAESDIGAGLPEVEESARPAFLTTSAGALPQGDDAAEPAGAGEGERAEAAPVEGTPAEADAEATVDAKASDLIATGPEAAVPAPSGAKPATEARVVTVPTNRNSRIVTLPSAARPSEGNRLSGPERIAFRQIAAALGARIEGEDAAPAPGAAPAGAPDRAADRATGAETASPDEGVAAAGVEPMPFAALDGAAGPAAAPSVPDGTLAEDRETGLPGEAAAEAGEPAGLERIEDLTRDVGEPIETAADDVEDRAAQAAAEAAAALQAVAAPEVSEPSAEAGAVPSALAQTAPIPSAFAQAAGEVATAMRLIDRLPIGAAVLKGEGIAHVNQAFLDMLGFEDLADLEAAGGIDALFAGEHVGRRFSEGGEDRPLPAITRDGQVIPVAARLVGIPWGAASALLLTLERRPRQQIEAVAETVSGRAALDALGEARERASELEAIVDTATDGVLMLDADGRVVSANRAAEALFGMERSEMTNRPLTDLLAPESRRSAQDYLDGLARNGVASVLNDGREVIGRVSPEGLIPLFMTIGRISSGPASKFCAVLRDITQWKKSEEELTEARRRAEEASVHKSEFLAKISHEIRTPLNAIIGFSEVMLDERFGSIGNDRYRDYLKDVHTSGAHIMSLINDLLDLSKVEAGKMELKFEAVSLADILGECVAMMQPQANRERIIIRTALPASVPPVVADPRSVRQIVLNLLSNAVKFTPAGGQVIVSTALEDSGEVVVRVRDTGLGMTEKEIQTALEPFRQLHTTRVRGGGTGLGLPLTKALVEANRAAFRIDSAVNQGTLVSITFPVTRVLAG